MNLLTLALGFIIALSLASPVFAHGGPSIEINALTLKLARGEDPAKNLTLRAEQYFRDGRFVQAHQDLDRAHMIGAANPELRARLFLAQNDPTQAHRALDTIATKADFSVQLLRARILVSLKRPGPAMAAYTQAMQLDTSVDCVLESAQLARELKAPDRARRILDQGLKDHGYAVLIALHRYRLAIETADHERAISISNRLIVLSRVPTDWLRRRAQAKRIAGDVKGADADLALALHHANRAVQKRKSPLMLVVRAKVFLALGERQSALKDARTALEIAPTYAPASDLRSSLEPQL